ncbi:hypothetical protein PAP_09995 [Palaeococcus pacificus DY20341]|uniref:Uncharacterized protein n=1 Tax=Palaeococcus pacificus DY20341 TaxID=1343739 RepID=A0A075M0S4_9EURY|nr:Trm112 family protein [Palaeococcus pacificus]AIF70373.1 hypothetical protein PAP_09995 [Palaeococcus pacificus DY20341]
MKRIADILACPKCRGELKREGERCKLKYPIVEGVPSLLIEEAKPLGE